jgi:Transposase DNA-binding/Transposase Tn5 dimerisation domain
VGMNIIDKEEWAQAQWGEADLGDRRRNQRAVLLGSEIAERPKASLPKETHCWKDLKAAYRLLNQEDVTHTKLIEPHCRQTLQEARARPVVLFIQDGSSLNFSSHPDTEGLGYIGDGKGRGIMLHSCMAVVPALESDKAPPPEILGIAAQVYWIRKELIHSEHQKKHERLSRRTEADVWAEIVEELGDAPSEEEVSWVSVGDRESDIFSYVARARAMGWHCLLRVTHDRAIERVEGAASGNSYLKSYVRSLPQRARKRVVVRGRDGRPKRQLDLRVSFAPVTLLRPGAHVSSKAAQEKDKVERVDGYCIRCWEASEDGEEWILFTTLEVRDAAAAKRMVWWYSHRWLIEEYHKCLKTGCSMEQRQLESAHGLTALLGFLAVVAVRLLQLRELSRERPEARAVKVVGKEMIEVLRRKLEIKKEAREWTLIEFWRAVARLGGFIGRKSDGQPGWQTIWDGWQRLQDLSWTIESAY